MSQRSYFIQPRSDSDWSSSALLADQEILNEFEKMSLPTYYRDSDPYASEYYPSQNPCYRDVKDDYYRDNLIKGIKEPKISNVPLNDNSLTNKIINAQGHPFEIRENEKITLMGQTGIYANKSDVSEWHGTIPVRDYPINEDQDNCEVVHKITDQQISLNQDITIKYLQPPTPQTPGDVIIRQEKGKPTPHAPPVIIRQQPLNPETPATLLFREKPPRPLKVEERVEISIPGKRLPPTPRQVVIERLPSLPPKPQPIVIERWLPIPEQKRKVVFIKAPEVTQPETPRNLIIEWEPYKTLINKEFVNLGVVKCNPEEYVQRYADSLMESGDLPGFVKEIKPPSGYVLAADLPQQTRKLEGDLHALSLVDRETLEKYNLIENTGYFQRIADSADVEPMSRWPSTSKKVHKSNLDLEKVYSEVFRSIIRDSKGNMSVDSAEIALEKLNEKFDRSWDKRKYNLQQIIQDLIEDGTIPFQKFEKAVRLLGR